MLLRIARRCAVLIEAMLLRIGYAVSGTDVRYAATHRLEELDPSLNRRFDVDSSGLMPHNPRNQRQKKSRKKSRQYKLYRDR
eukprot:2978830-Rhodomonas_salina.1